MRRFQGVPTCRGLSWEELSIFHQELGQKTSLDLVVARGFCLGVFGEGSTRGSHPGPAIRKMLAKSLWRHILTSSDGPANLILKVWLIGMAWWKFSMASAQI